jgi:hypothetical protein
LPPLSEGTSKLGEVLNLIKAVTVSEVTMLKSAASTPDEIVTVADSEILIVAALAEVAMFSAAENEEDEVKVGAVVSGAAGGPVNLVIVLEVRFAVYKEPAESIAIPQGFAPVVPMIDETPAAVILVTLLEL